jgi:hypothetical protein
MLGQKLHNGTQRTLSSNITYVEDRLYQPICKGTLAAEFAFQHPEADFRRKKRGAWRIRKLKFGRK